MAQRFDMLLWNFETTVDTTVDTLIPRGTCSRNRWITFDLETVAPNIKTFRYSMRYQACSNYITYQALLGTEIFNEGCHDSCWRDRAMRMDPHFEWPDAEEMLCHSITVEGNPQVRWMNPTEDLSVYKDATWINNTGLTGPFAVIAGMAYLKPRVTRLAAKPTLQISATWHRYPKGVRKHKDYFASMAFKFNSEGQVTHYSVSSKQRLFDTVDWVEVSELFFMSREKFLTLCGVAPKHLTEVGIHHLGLDTLAD